MLENITTDNLWDVSNWIERHLGDGSPITQPVMIYDEEFKYRLHTGVVNVDVRLVRNPVTDFDAMGKEIRVWHYRLDRIESREKMSGTMVVGNTRLASGEHLEILNWLTQLRDQINEARELQNAPLYPPAGPTPENYGDW